MAMPRFPLIVTSFSRVSPERSMIPFAKGSPIALMLSLFTMILFAARSTERRALTVKSIQAPNLISPRRTILLSPSGPSAVSLMFFSAAPG